MSTPKPETFEAHGHTWTRHTPGDPNPVPAEAEDDIWILSGTNLTNRGYSCLFDWGPPRGHPGNCIVGWRYASLIPEKPASQSGQ